MKKKRNIKNWKVPNSNSITTSKKKEPNGKYHPILGIYRRTTTQ